MSVSVVSCFESGMRDYDVLLSGGCVLNCLSSWLFSWRRCLLAEGEAMKIIDYP